MKMKKLVILVLILAFCCLSMSQSFASESWNVSNSNEWYDYDSLDNAEVGANKLWINQFDLSSKSFVDSCSSGSASPGDMAWNSDGTKIYDVHKIYEDVYQYDVGTAWDVSTRDAVDYNYTFKGSGSSGITWNSDGTKFYLVGYDSDNIYQYDVGTAWDLSTWSLDYIFQVDGARDIGWKPDGTKFYVITESGELREYGVDLDWHIDSAQYFDNVQLYDYWRQGGITWKPDGTKLYQQGRGDNLKSYYLGSAWDLSTITYHGETAPKDTQTYGMTWKPDGTKLYEVDYDGDIYEYNTDSFNRASWESSMWSDFSGSREVSGLDVSTSIGSNQNVKVRVLGDLDDDGFVGDSGDWITLSDGSNSLDYSDLGISEEYYGFKVQFKLESDKTSSTPTVDSFNFEVKSLKNHNIENVSISNKYVDQNVSWADSQANSDVELSVRVSDNENIEDIDVVEFDIIDNTGNIRETIEAGLDYKVDDFTAVYSAVYDPSTLEDYQRAGFDYVVRALDYDKNKDSQRENEAFYVSDFEVEATVSYDDNENMVDVQGSASPIDPNVDFSPDDVFIDDSDWGTLSANISGKNFELSYEGNGEDITIRVLSNSGIDGIYSTTYTSSTSSDSDVEIGGGISYIFLLVLGAPILILILVVIGRVIKGIRSGN